MGVEMVSDVWSSVHKPDWDEVLPKDEWMKE